MRSLRNAVLWTVGLLMTAIGIWQFYLFATYKDSEGVVDLQGGTIHLWLAIGASLAACACLFLGIFRRINQAEEFHITS